MLKHYLNFFSDTDNQDPVESREPQDKIPYRTYLSLLHKVDYQDKKHHSTGKINPCTSEKSKVSADEKLHLKTIHQTNPSLKE